MKDDSLQLDLTATISEVPQANSLPLFVNLMQEIHRGSEAIPELAEKLEIEERTVHYYVDFGRWLGFLQTARPAQVALTTTGDVFVDSVPSRGRLFASAIFSRQLVQTVNALKRESTNDDDVETLDTRDACVQAIQRMTDLSETTAKRRASGLAHMLEAAYRPSRIDWSTGESLPHYRNVTFDFEGRTFLTTMAARQFSSERDYRVGFPLQVRRFVEDRGQGLSAKTWKRASYDSSDGKATWFGSMPVNESTIEIAERGGRDLRKLLVTCAPYVTLATALLTYRDALKRPSVRLTHDMYGMRFWEHDRDLGSPIEVIAAYARHLDLEPVMGMPRGLSHAPTELTEPGTDEDLMATLTAAGILVEKDTTYDFAAGVEPEFREGGDTTPSVTERLRPLQAVLPALFRELEG